MPWARGSAQVIRPFPLSSHRARASTSGFCVGVAAVVEVGVAVAEVPGAGRQHDHLDLLTPGQYYNGCISGGVICKNKLILKAGRITVEFVRGAVVGGLWGNLASIVLALLIVLGSIMLPGGEWDGGAFVRGMILMPIFIGVWVVPLSVVFGLVYVIIRRAVRLMRCEGVSVGS